MSVIEQLNLRPQEKRILVVVGFLIFVVLNWMFVRPLFGQWEAGQDELAKTQRTKEKYEAEIAKTPSYKALEENLKKSGNQVLTEELGMSRIVEQAALAAGIQVNRSVPGTRATNTRTNAFFEDQGLTVDFNGYSTNFVEWLVSVATGDSMIRIQEMRLNPHGGGQQLAGSVHFVASFQKKAAPKASAVASAAAATARQTTVSTNAAAANKAAAKPAQSFSAPKTSIPTNSAATRPATNTTKPPPKK